MTLAFAPERIETWPLARLQPYAKNAKVHGPDQVAKIAASMAEFGWTVPCLVGEDGELIAGHGRVMAATQLGLTEAPVIVLGHLTEAQRRAYRIADNKLTELGNWDEAMLSAELQDLLADDYDLSLVGFSDGELDKLLAFDPDGGGEEEGGAGGSVPPVTIPEPPRNPASRTGDLWILGDHRLLCGDSTSRDDVRRLMNGERAVLFATDPPYLVDYDGSNHPTRNKDWSQSYGVTWDDSSQGAELYDGFIAAAVAEAITEDAAWYCWHASRRQAMLETCWEKAGAFVHQQIIWVKDRGVLTRSHYLWKHEPCFMGCAASKSAEVLARFIEVESGKRNDRPELDKALTLARLTGATLVIAKLDRLSRNAAFLLTLQGSGVSFLACDMPEANDLTVGIMALVAQAEREAISRRTKEALAAAKARGVKLGNPNGAAALRRAGKGGLALQDIVRRNADQFAEDLRDVVTAIRADGHTTLRAMADELNARGIRTRRGGKWHVSTVRNLLERLDRR